MKKTILLLAVMVMTILSFNAQADDMRIDQNQLPKAARQFIAKHFAKDKIAYASMDKDIISVDYEVKLQSGVDIDFNGDGHWTDISCSEAQFAVPTSIIPVGISSYVNSNYPSSYIIEISRKHHRFEVELNNDVDLVFDKAGKFLRVDH